MKKSLYFLVFISTFFVSCKSDRPIVVTSEDYCAAVDTVTNIMIHDIFSPPVASRIYVYPNIAAYEIMAQNNPKFSSLQGQLKGLEAIPALDTKGGVNQHLAALIAHLELSKQLVFSEEAMVKYRDSLYQKWGSENNKEFETSKEYALKVAEVIKKWMSQDNYKQTRTFPKFSVNTKDPSRWQPTPPAYMDAVEPHWNKIRTLVMDSASQFKPEPPYPFDTQKNSKFYLEALETYQVGNEISKKLLAVEKNPKIALPVESVIATFWDCNPYATVTQGHMMFAKKKNTPDAHWMNIAKIACKKSKADLETTIFAYTKTSIGIFESFISCWDEKFRSNVVRPETYINQHIDENWKPQLQTPPFPEYTSGHSVVSACSSVILTAIFGDNFSYTDDSEIPFGLPKRDFTSFKQAASEASMSRLYGGIHYRAAIENGVSQGTNLGNYINNKLKMKK
ncbi:vanadium-dependent haloperoxidase [Flavobacterium branchiophilum]|uniref:Phosphoesterase, PA-phosphatase related n=2 Tax=Flavobacterium branchiophilum TaxID=55197 RepID=G2Z5E5_FLABF|nr:vanadium-dependent haloperoxidase [Flavobacterium branchiophilum]PDS24214.1 phosphatase PAP2 family protein [Flavobacterium branchiophilum]CCB68658.1 Phosphoesterase, PA-phosphatase related precursor [Flavobacterium branchiophilum FL-15]